ncbi:hypothetical protein BBJ29_003372, partial [Phytophthora kernoviae]
DELKNSLIAMSELYENKVCLSPMVRSGTLPLRLLSLRYGADLVYGEEIVDKRIISAVRVPNAVLDTVDFVSRNGDSVVFRTCPEETGKVVFQIGTADAVLALKAAEQVARDVAAVDINMGCPKHFSVQGGMGAALLRKPEVACDIHERPHDKASWEALAPVVSALSVPVLANGDVFEYNDIDKLRQISGASSFLIARGALANPSIFRKEGYLPIDQVTQDYLKVSAEVDNVYQNTKYNAMRMIPSSLEDARASSNKYGFTDTSRIVTVPELAATRSGLQMFQLWNLQNFYEQYQDRFRAKAAALGTQSKQEDQVLTTLPTAHDRYAESIHSTDGEVPKARNNRAGKPELFCETCKIQLLSQQDVKLHYKGRKHKGVLRRQASATISKFVAKAAVQPEPTAQTPAASEIPKTVDNSSNENGKTVSEERKHDGEDQRNAKRVKREANVHAGNEQVENEEARRKRETVSTQA